MRIHYAVLLCWSMCAVLCGGCTGSGTPAGTAIAVIPMGTTHEYWKSIHAGALKAAAETDVEIIWKGPLREDDVDEQIQIVETFTAMDVSAIVLAPLDSRALVRPVRDAAAMGIPTVIVDSALESGDGIAFVSTDNYRGGVLGARHLAALMDGTGNVILVRVNEGSASSTAREEGFLATIREEFPGITVLSGNQYAGITTETAYRTCENLLNRYDTVEGIFTPNESTTFGCLRALQDRGLAGDIVFVGFDVSEKLIDALAAGELMGLVVQNPFKMGYESVRTAARYLNGESVPERVDTGATVVTAEIMHTPAVQSLLHPDLSRWLKSE